MYVRCLIFVEMIDSQSATPRVAHSCSIGHKERKQFVPHGRLICVGGGEKIPTPNGEHVRCFSLRLPGYVVE